MVLGLLSVWPAAAGEPPLPDAVQSALFDVYAVEAKDRASYLEGRKITRVDLTGDGSPEYIVEVLSEGGSDGSQTCVNEVFAARGTVYVEAYGFVCCTYRATAPGKGKPGMIRCDDKDHRKVLLTWKGSWPAFRRSLTQTEVKAAFEQGLQLLREKKYAEAREGLCKYAEAQGDKNPEYENGCATVEISLKQFHHAESILTDGIARHPEYAPFYANLGTLAEAQGDLQKALEHYEKYLSLATSGAGRKRIEERVARLKKTAAP